MAYARVKAVVLFLVALCSIAADAQILPARGLRRNFYQYSCPTAEALIRAQVEAAYRSDSTSPAGLIRMFFHDCFVRGCDGSVLIVNPDSERLGAPNANSLRGFEVLDAAKSAVERVCPGVVSCADVIAFAARDAMELAGNIKVGIWYGGRRDGSTSVSAETLVNLPAPFANFSTLQAAFRKKGLNDNDLIILSGGHSIGKARCAIIFQRIYNFKGTGQADPRIDPSYVPILRSMCRQDRPGDRINMEMLTPTILDVNYFNDVTRRRGLFESDDALTTTPLGRALTNIYRVPQLFNISFVNSMRKMGNIEVLTGTQGKIRSRCDTA